MKDCSGEYSFPICRARNSIRLSADGRSAMGDPSSIPGANQTDTTCTQTHTPHTTHSASHSASLRHHPRQRTSPPCPVPSRRRHCCCRGAQPSAFPLCAQHHLYCSRRIRTSRWWLTRCGSDCCGSSIAATSMANMYVAQACHYPTAGDVD